MIKTHHRLRFSLTIFALLFVVTLPALFLNSLLDEAQIHAFVTSFGILSPSIYTLLLTITYIFPSLVVFPLWLIGLTAFGSPLGYICIFIANLAGSTLNYYLAKKFGRWFIKKTTSPQSLAEIDKLAKITTADSIFYLRVFGGSLSDYVSYAAGLAKIHFPLFFISTLVGSLPMQLFAFYILSLAGDRGFLAVTGLVSIYYLVNFAFSLLTLPMIIGLLRQSARSTLPPPPSDLSN